MKKMCSMLLTKAADAGVSDHSRSGVNTISERCNANAAASVGDVGGAGSRQSFQTLSIFNAAVSPVPINPSPHRGVVKCSAPPPPPPHHHQREAGHLGYNSLYVVSDRILVPVSLSLVSYQNR